MGWKGDFKKLRELTQALSPRGISRLYDSLQVNLDREAVRLVRQGFERETDPYGRPWAPVKSDPAKAMVKRRKMVKFMGIKLGYRTIKRRAHMILQDTKALYRSFQPHPIRGAIGVQTQDPKFKFYQQDDGPGQKVIQRMMLPKLGDVPTEWGKAFDRVAKQIIDKAFRRIGK